jgi:hypothetical protein
MIRKLLARLICPEIFEDYDNLMYYKEKYSAASIQAEINFRKLIERNENQKTLIKELEEENYELKQNGETVIDGFCKTHFKQVPKFAYKDKGLFKQNRFSMYPNEMIQPEFFLVKELKNEVKLKEEDSIYTKAVKVGEYIDKRLKWTSDENTTGHMDVYQDVYAAIMDNKQDCETHASLVSSIEPELGIAFGFAGSTGHAWNVFVYKSELWCLETNSVYDKNKNVKVFKYANQNKYRIHWIFTKDKTYQVMARPRNFGVKVY